jgi:hypothetical protein
MITTMRHRHYDNDGLAKQCSMSCYEMTMYSYCMGQRSDAALAEQLRSIVARVNNHSLGLLQEMLDFAVHENIYDARLVNDQAVAWASQVSLFDLQGQAELAAWRARLTDGL